MFANRFTALLDANVLAPALTAQDLLLTMEARGLGDAADLLRDHAGAL